MKTEQATFGGGCFWCTEAVFRRLRGVQDVVAGYAGGRTERPRYEEVSGGSTGHAEVVQITYDSAVISYSDLLEVFWSVHDPTTMNRQGADVGTQYRSVIFAHDKDQRKLALEAKTALESKKVWPQPLVTKILPLGTFFPAETYHQEYFAKNPTAPYCRVVIEPKVGKLLQKFRDKVV